MDETPIILMERYLLKSVLNLAQAMLVLMNEYFKD